MLQWTNEFLTIYVMIVQQGKHVSWFALLLFFFLRMNEKKDENVLLFLPYNVPRHRWLVRTHPQSTCTELTAAQILASWRGHYPCPGLEEITQKEGKIITFVLFDSDLIFNIRPFKKKCGPNMVIYWHYESTGESWLAITPYFCTYLRCVDRALIRLLLVMGLVSFHNFLNFYLGIIRYQRKSVILLIKFFLTLKET